MRPGLDSPTWTNALTAAGITTVMLAWFDFESGPVGLWTGSHSITISDSDGLLNGKTFEPIVNGAMVNVGANAFSYSGSDELSVSVAIPETPTDAMVYASLDPDEFQGRTAVLWRGVMTTSPTASTPAAWMFKRTRAGAMDTLRITNSTEGHLFTLGIEGHASMISNATGSTYLDQKKFDPTDTSQDFAVNIANNPSMPSRGGSGGGIRGGGGSGFGNNGGGGWSKFESNAGSSWQVW